MTHHVSPESLFFGPLTPNWTITDLLEWIGADDARCHDERLAGVLDAVSGGLDVESLPPGGRVVARVRAVASRVRAHPAAGERTLGDVVRAREESVEEGGVLVSA